MSRPLSPVLSAPTSGPAQSYFFFLLVATFSCCVNRCHALLPPAPATESSIQSSVISNNVVASFSRLSHYNGKILESRTNFRRRTTIRYATEKLAEVTKTSSDTSAPSSSSEAPKRRQLARGLLLSSFSDGLVPNPQALDFWMDSLVESMWNQYLQGLQEKVESSAKASPCCGPTDVDSVNQLLDAISDESSSSFTDEATKKTGQWKVKFQKLLEMQQHQQEQEQSGESLSLSSSPLELRFLYIPTAMYALRKDSTNSPGKQRQRARADGKKRRTQIVQLIQDQFANAYHEMNDCSDDDIKEQMKSSPVKALAVSFDLDDGSLKQPEGSKNTSKFPSTGMDALKDWKPNLIYVQGGNTFWLYHCMEKGGWRDALVDAVTVGDDNNNQAPAVYCGTSAGAILAGSLMETATWKGWDDPTVDPDRPNYEDWKGIAGLDLAGENVSVFPHMGEQWQDIVDGKMAQLNADTNDDGDHDSSDFSLPAPEVYCLRDDQAVCVNGSGSVLTRTLLEYAPE
ncbi:unnamed protein product [Cylindrotheca closterium]|uniref:Uncharacterized protein n=1 Tax=Cylindrotheca closterium TaxID=2856 RepID=A0AAD2JGW8_9STRA|nr:unnamed protein product [Cylindrotheca closterium]